MLFPVFKKEIERMYIYKYYPSTRSIESRLNFSLFMRPQHVLTSFDHKERKAVDYASGVLL